MPSWVSIIESTGWNYTGGDSNRARSRWLCYRLQGHTARAIFPYLQLENILDSVELLLVSADPRVSEAPTPPIFLLRHVASKAMLGCGQLHALTGAVPRGELFEGLVFVPGTSSEG